MFLPVVRQRKGLLGPIFSSALLETTMALPVKFHRNRPSCFYSFLFKYQGRCFRPAAGQPLLVSSCAENSWPITQCTVSGCKHGCRSRSAYLFPQVIIVKITNVPSKWPHAVMRNTISGLYSCPDVNSLCNFAITETNSTIHWTHNPTFQPRELLLCGNERSPEVYCSF